MDDLDEFDAIANAIDSAADDVNETERELDEDAATEIVDHLLSFDEQRARLDAQYKVRVRNLERARESFRERVLPDLEDWLLRNPPKGKAKYRDLATGRVGFRTKPGGFRVTDKVAALGWAMRQAPKIVETSQVHNVARDALAEHFKSTRILPEGCKIEKTAQTFYVKPPKKEGRSENEG